MKIKALSHYNEDFDTRFGDCILVYDNSRLIIYDCGHSYHAEFIKSFLRENKSVSEVYIVVSHNDNDHTSGVCDLLRWLSKNGYTTSIYTHQYLRYVDTILDKIDDGRRNRESLKRALLAEFDNIREIIETAQKCEISTYEALSGTSFAGATIAGPTINEFTDVAAKAVDSRETNSIGSGHAEETVMNAASVQLKFRLDDGGLVLLCGDATPNYIKSLGTYDLIQLPHHGQRDDAIAVFDELGGDAYSKKFLISDNTGSGTNSGGSEKLIMYMKEEKYTPAYNTQNGIVELSRILATSSSTSQGRNFLGDLDSI